MIISKVLKPVRNCYRILMVIIDPTSLIGEVSPVEVLAKDSKLPSMLPNEIVELSNY